MKKRKKPAAPEGPAEPVGQAASLSVRDVTQIFRAGFWLRPVKVLDGVTLDVPKGSVFGFLGANGAGKTTLIHLAVGLRKPTSGQVLICGLDAGTTAARSRVGYLPERPYFHEHLTGEALLRYFGSLSGMPRDAIEARIPAVLESVGMASARKVELRRYSKGMLQRIGIAQAILHDPEFLVLDEPMSGLDPIGRKEIRELITRLSAEGHTVFFSSHVIPDVEAVCNQVALIKKGRIIGCGPISKLLSEGESHVEVAFSGMTEADAKKLGVFDSVQALADGVGGWVRGTDEANEAVRALLAKKARIHSVMPVRPSLETYFGERAFERE